MVAKLTAALKSVFGVHDVSTQAKECVGAICQEALERSDGWADRTKLSGLPAWENLKTRDETLQIEVALHSAIRGNRMSGSMDDEGWQAKDVKTAIASQLLRRKLPFGQAHLAPLIFHVAKQRYLDFGLPVGSILNATERHCQGRPASGQLKLALQALKLKIDYLAMPYGMTKSLKKIKDRVNSILNPAAADAAVSMPQGAWSRALAPWLEDKAAKDRQAWVALLAFAGTAGDKSKPARKWLTTGKPLLSAIGETAVADQLSKWLTSTTPEPERIDTSLDALKGLIWLSVHLDHDEIAGPIGRFAEVCFRKVPAIGARSVKLGNACVLALSALKGSDAAVAELVRLKTRIKYGSVRDLVARRLAELAEEKNVTVADLEESSLLDFGFAPDGRQEVELGDARAIIELGAAGATLNWLGADNKPRKAPPVSVKRDFAGELKALRQKVKDVDIAWGVQVARLEAAWVEDRSWSLDTWRARYLDHPLRQQISRSLIWRIDDAGQTIDVMPSNENLLARCGRTVTPSSSATVRLWHPLDASPADVLAWRQHIVAAGMTQPIKQAHREVYVLTDAERTTDIYSNRFAAHILRQHQFRALCHARGWRYDLQGEWDSWNVPSRHIPEHDLTVEYYVEMIANDESSESYIPLHIATDQVRFVGANSEPLSLEAVPPILFSELMRDVDLFVAVTSVANDPDWVDGGPEGRHGGYWSEYAFGDLSQTARTRRDLIAEIVPKLAIADRLQVTDKFLEVEGKRHAYRIHLGSSNIQIVPSNRYLCIVRGRTPKDKHAVHLPFIGDNLLSIILSKAFMLANDDKITDKTILSQLGR